MCLSLSLLLLSGSDVDLKVTWSQKRQSGFLHVQGNYYHCFNQLPLPANRAVLLLFKNFIYFFFSVAVSVKQRTRCSECGAAIAVTMLDGFPPSAKIESEGDSHRTG